MIVGRLGGAEFVYHDTGSYAGIERTISTFENVDELHYLFNAARVAGPTKPSGSSFADVWNSLTADCVNAPKYPVTGPL